MSQENDSDRMPLDVRPMTNGEKRDAQVRVLETLCEHLTLQMADLMLGQHAGVLRDAEFRQQVDGMKKKQADIAAATAEVLEIMSAAKMGFKVLGWVGTLFKWGGSLAGAAIAIWALWHAVRTGSPFPPGDK